MRRIRFLLALVVLAATPGFAQTATELRKELLQALKKAQADGKDVSEAKREFDEGVKMLNDGMPDEAVEHFTKSKGLMPK